VVVLEDVEIGETIDFGNGTVIARSATTMPHKIALQDIAEGQEIYKYGEVIGYATQPIREGEHVHVHNLDSEKLMK
jgi:altronate dehydratase